MAEVIHRVGGVAIDHETECTVDALAPAVIDRLNTRYADTLLLIGRSLGGRPGATSARVLQLDRVGIDLVVEGAGRTHYLHIDHVVAIDHPGEICDALCALVRLARERSGDTGTTSFEQVMPASV